jgi:hypothetical protein
VTIIANRPQGVHGKKKPRSMQGSIIESKFLCLYGRLNQHVTAVAATVNELDGARDLGEKGVIFTATNVGAGFDPGSTLTNDDGSTRDKLSTKSFYAESLRVRVAPVS